jgi:hypothetical protein
MAPRRPEPVLGVLGAVGAALGVVAARCGGGCGACLACAVPVLGLAAAALVTGRRRRPEGEPPRAPAGAGEAGA